MRPGTILRLYFIPVRIFNSQSLEEEAVEFSLDDEDVSSEEEGNEKDVRGTE